MTGMTGMGDVRIWHLNGEFSLHAGCMYMRLRAVVFDFRSS